MKNLTDFRKMVETGVDPGLEGPKLHVNYCRPPSFIIPSLFGNHTNQNFCK